MNRSNAVAFLVLMMFASEAAAQTTMEWLFAPLAPAVEQSVRLSATVIRTDPIRSPRDPSAIQLVFEVYQLEKTTDNPAVRKYRFSHVESATVILRPGESASLEFSTGGELIQVRPVIFADPSVALVPSVEIREQGRLLFVTGLIEARKGSVR